MAMFRRRPALMCIAPNVARTPMKLKIVQETRLHSVLGFNSLTTKSHHIQAIVDLGAGLRVTARATDGVIEAIESDDGRIVGVQFHPERMDEAGLPLFVDLLKRASAAP